MSLIKKSGKKVISYISMGVLAFLSEYITFYVLWGASKNVVTAQTISFLIGLTISFLGSRNLTFKAHKLQGYRYSDRAQIFQFTVLGLVNLFITNIGMVTIINHLHVDPYFSKLIMMGGVAGWNYLLFNWVIFKSLK